MFGFGKPKQSPSEPSVARPTGAPGSPIIAALLMDAGDGLDLKKCAAAIERARPAGQSPTNLNRDSNQLSFNLGDDFIVIAPMPAPYPWSDLKGPCATSWMWPKGTSAMSVERHKTHV